MNPPPPDPQPPPITGAPYYLPAGLPPGHDPMGQQDGPPEAVYYFRIYGTLMAIMSFVASGAGLAMVVSSLMNPPAPGSYASSDAVAGMIWAAMGAVGFIPFLIALLGGRRIWVHTLATILIALSMTSLCCLPVGIPLLIVWIKPETRRWYGGT